MQDRDKVNFNSNERMEKQVLTDADLKKLIAEKFERARTYSNMLRKREILLEGR